MPNPRVRLASAERPVPRHAPAAATKPINRDVPALRSTKKFDSMRSKILAALVLAALLYAGLRLAEHMSKQELTRATRPDAPETICLMWQPHLLRGNGLCYLDLRNAQDKITSTAPLGTLDSGFNALQQFGQLDFQGATLTVSSRQTGQASHRFTVQDGKLVPGK